VLKADNTDRDAKSENGHEKIRTIEVRNNCIFRDQQALFGTFYAIIEEGNPLLKSERTVFSRTVPFILTS
jgi:hypothetical protein